MTTTETQNPTPAVWVTRVKEITGWGEYVAYNRSYWAEYQAESRTIDMAGELAEAFARCLPDKERWEHTNPAYNAG